MHDLSKDELITNAREIAATEYCKRALCALPMHSQYVGYLLRFTNPLEVVRDAWLAENECDLSEEFEHTLWWIKDRGAAEQDYETKAEIRQAEESDPVDHPRNSMEMM